MKIKFGCRFQDFFYFADLSPLNDLKYLLILDASHNKLTKLLDFSPPKNLQKVDLSYNDIEEMTDLTPHHYLMSLVLDRILDIFIFQFDGNFPIRVKLRDNVFYVKITI